MRLFLPLVYKYPGFFPFFVLTKCENQSLKKLKICLYFGKKKSIISKNIY